MVRKKQGYNCTGDGNENTKWHEMSETWFLKGARPILQAGSEIAPRVMMMLLVSQISRIRCETESSLQFRVSKPDAKLKWELSLANFASVFETQN